MKRKVGMLLDEELYRRAKRRAADEGRPFCDLIQDAIESYLSSRTMEPATRDAAYRLFCEHPMKLTTAQFIAVLAADLQDATA
jgi:predicted DNA-binding protein